MFKPGEELEIHVVSKSCAEALGFDHRAEVVLRTKFDPASAYILESMFAVLSNSFMISIEEEPSAPKDRGKQIACVEEALSNIRHLPDMVIGFDPAPRVDTDNFLLYVFRKLTCSKCERAFQAQAEIKVVADSVPEEYTEHFGVWLTGVIGLLEKWVEGRSLDKRCEFCSPDPELLKKPPVNYQLSEEF